MKSIVVVVIFYGEIYEFGNESKISGGRMAILEVIIWQIWWWLKKELVK